MTNLRRLRVPVMTMRAVRDQPNVVKTFILQLDEFQDGSV